jgi:hypothetical protein
VILQPVAFAGARETQVSEATFTNRSGNIAVNLAPFKPDF